ncbi:MAG: hypothetical protein GPJ54_04350 [Candidatus Heimdallarchaeota archaeon]|nr:hypothetical protein [Candidatus Heimdallarchaeota archaeon]
MTEEEFEVSVKCPKRKKSVISHNYASMHRIKNKKNFYVIKRPTRGNLRLKLFCYFCENYYHLKINSEEGQKRKKQLQFIIYIILALTFWYSNLPIGVVRYTVWAYLFYKIYRSLNISFVNGSKNHIARIVRKWEPVQANQ